MPQYRELSSDAQWCRDLFDRLREGGVWEVPRSGIVFQKRGDELVEISRLDLGAITDRPMPAFSEYQERDFQAIKEHFGLVGVTVRKEEDADRTV